MKILIAGLPKTGTTALLYLIANSIGKEPLLLFEPKVCPVGLESKNGDVLAKVLIRPGLSANSFAHFERKITIFRDPRDLIVSGLLYSQYHASYLNDDGRVRIMRECLERKESSPSSVPIREILEVIGKVTGNPDRAVKHRENMGKMLARFDDYVATIVDGFLYQYEDFVSGKYGSLERYLGIPMSGTAEVPDKLKRVARTKGYGDWRNWFTPEDVQDYRPMLASWLEKYGYDAQDWTLNAKPSIAPEHCSRYFMRLVGEYRENRSGETRQSVPGKKRAGMLTGKVVRAEPGIVTGWAMASDSGQPVRVTLLVNGSAIAQTVADKPRPGLKSRGVHPTGRCGFVFRFHPENALRVGDRVTVKPVDGDVARDNMLPVAIVTPTSGVVASAERGRDIVLEVSMEEVLGARRHNKDISAYPSKADPRFLDGLVFPAVSPRFKISRGVQIFTIGSCFARNIEEKLAGFELPTTRFTAPKAEWGARPNGLLNEYNPGTMHQRISHALSGTGFGDRAIVRYAEDYSDLLLHGGTPVSMERALQRRGEIDAIYAHLRLSELVVITLGLVQAWYDTKEQLYLNRMPSSLAMKNAPGRYTMRTLDVETSYSLLGSAVEKIIAAGIQKVLVTVSPVPLQTAFSGVDATITNCYSKSVLRVCAQRLFSDFKQVDYFPSYEIALSGGANALMDDNVHVKDEIVERITRYMTDLYVL